MDNMADITPLTENIESTADTIPVSANQTPRTYNGYLSKPYAEYCSSQKLKIELYRLKFLRDCKSCKRPPPSIRIRGASSIKQVVRLKKFSMWETDLLNEAIKEKLLVIKELQRLSALEGHQLLTIEENRNILKHFQKKIDFYVTQDKTKWKDWPTKKSKKENRKTNVHHKRRQKRRKKKTEADAKSALESGSVVILVKEEIPPGAVAILGKGLNYIPTPKTNIREEQLDMRLVSNKILRTANNSGGNENSSTKYSLPSKLAHKKYGPAIPAKENTVNVIVDNMVSEHNGLLQFKKYIIRKKNITKDEEDGLNWLIKETNESRLAVVKADKGGALLIVYPELLKQKVIEKLTNPILYKKLEKDPTAELYNELFNLWVKGKKAGFVTTFEAEKVMGVTEKNNKSTSSHFKPGISYFYPMLKIHKLSKDDLKPGINPPARLITALQEGVSKRSDVFLADHYLKELEADFCKDLVKDTNEALVWLDNVNKNYTSVDKKIMKSFTFDFKSLYDSIKPKYVKEALSYAIRTCRPKWTAQKRQWILDLVDHSLRASVGKFDNNWYLQKEGVPTGGSLCVQLANIAVYYIMNKVLYTNRRLMSTVKEVKRYIDDGAGFFVGSEQSFITWINSINTSLKKYGLFIDESVLKQVNEFAHFLDIQFCFDLQGNLQTDLYTKPTDKRSYLYFGSAHPNHVYSGIVHSQCLRLRRIINSQDRLKSRLDELCSCFKVSGYPESMLKNISDKVLNMERSLCPKRSVEKNRDSICITSCYGTDEKLVKSLKKYENDLLKTNSFKNKTKPVFSYIKRTGPNIGSKLSVLKSIALGNKIGKTVRCNSINCMCCKLISSDQIVEINGQLVHYAPGNCKTKNCIYLVLCRACKKPYIGRTVQAISNRMTGHRDCFKLTLENQENIDYTSDDFSLGLHLVNEHGCSNKSDLNKMYNVHILENCSPALLEKQEHNYIHRYDTLYPKGLNKVNPFRLPRLDLE